MRNRDSKETGNNSSVTALEQGCRTQRSTQREVGGLGESREGSAPLEQKQCAEREEGTISGCKTEGWEPGKFIIADLLINLQLAEQDKEVYFLVDAGASYHL